MPTQYSQTQRAVLTITTTYWISSSSESVVVKWCGGDNSMARQQSVEAAGRQAGRQAVGVGVGS
jgi:hypothetical protein